MAVSEILGGSRARPSLHIAFPVKCLTLANEVPPLGIVGRSSACTPAKTDPYPKGCWQSCKTGSDVSHPASCFTFLSVGILFFPLYLFGRRRVKYPLDRPTPLSLRMAMHWMNREYSLYRFSVGMVQVHIAESSKMNCRD